MGDPRTRGKIRDGDMPNHPWGARWGQLSRGLGLEPESPVVLALSGGADSVYLLHVLARSVPRPPVTVAHVEHGLRGRESDEDAQFCARLCEGLGLPFESLEAPIEPGANLEARARSARYRALEGVVHRVGARALLTGHHSDDALETLLMRWMRGTDPAGLCGLRAVRRLLGDGGQMPTPPGSPTEHAQDSPSGAPLGEGPWLVRPLLAMRREEVRCQLTDEGLAWREDSSNRDPRFTRNRIRHRVLPRIAERHGAEALENLRTFGRTVEELEDRFARRTAHLRWRPVDHAPASRAADEVSLGGQVARTELTGLPRALQRRALWRLILEGTGRGPGRSLLQTLLDDLAQGRRVRRNLPRGYWLLLRSTSVVLQPPLARFQAEGFGTEAETVGEHGLQLPLPFPGPEGLIESHPARPARPAQPSHPSHPARPSAELPPTHGTPHPDGSGRISVHDHGLRLGVPGRVILPDGRALHASWVEATEHTDFPSGPREAHLDPAGLPDTLWVRWRTPGDRFHPLGGPGHRPLRRFLADAGVPREERDRVPLVFAARELIWVAGMRPCHPRRVLPGTGVRLHLRLEDASATWPPLEGRGRSTPSAAHDARRPRP